MRAARKRFLDSGVDGASLRQIARDADTNIGMIYYYFPTKDDLFLAVVEEVYEVLLLDLERALSGGATFAERVEAMYVRIGSLSNLELEVVRLVVREALASSTRLERLLERFKRGHVPIVFQTVADGIQEGSIDPRHHPVAIVMSTLALGVAPQLMRRIARSHLPVTGLPEGPAFARSLVSILLSGVGSSSPTPSPSSKP